MKPRLDHYLGRHVERVEYYGDEDESSDWHIVLAGGIVIKNHDGRRTAIPDYLRGHTFMMVTMGELDTELHFGHNAGPSEKLTLTPTKYSLSDPRLPAEEEYFPQTDPENLGSGLPDDEKIHAQRRAAQAAEFMGDEGADS